MQKRQPVIVIANCTICKKFRPKAVLYTNNKAGKQKAMQKYTLDQKYEKLKLPF